MSTVWLTNYTVCLGINRLFIRHHRFIIGPEAASVKLPSQDDSNCMYLYAYKGSSTNIITVLM